MESNKFQYILSGIWFATLSYICFGYGTGDNYTAAPLFICISLVILYIYGSNLSAVIKPLSSLSILYVITSIGYLLNPTSSSISYIQYLCYSLTGCMTAIVAFCLVKKNSRMLKVFAYMMLSFFVVGIFRFFKEQSLLESFYAITSFYFLLFPLPIILCCTNKKSFHILILSTTIIFCVLSLKRSALIASILLLVMYLFLVAKSSAKHFIYIGVLLLIMIVVASKYLQNTDFFEYSSRLFDRLENIDEDKGSGRGDVIELFFKNDIYDLIDFPDILIGRGYEAYHRQHLNLAAAHNDFIEIIYSSGLLGLICLCRFFYLIYKKSAFLSRNNSELTVPYASATFLFFFYAFASSNFYFYYLSIPLFLTIGAFEGYLYSTNKIYQ